MADRAATEALVDQIDRAYLVETLAHLATVPTDVPLGFETLTFAPIERRLVDASMLSEAELKWLNDYHAEVLEKIGPRLEGEDKAWLERQCAPLSR